MENEFLLWVRIATPWDHRVGREGGLPLPRVDCFPCAYHVCPVNAFLVVHPFKGPHVWAGLGNPLWLLVFIDLASPSHHSGRNAILFLSSGSPV